MLKAYSRYIQACHVYWPIHDRKLEEMGSLEQKTTVRYNILNDGSKINFERCSNNKNK